MKFANTLLSAALCASLALPVTTFAAVPSQSSAEFNLVRDVTALTGQRLTADQSQAALAKTLSQYEAVSVKDDQQEARFVQALVDNNVYTADQAQALFANSLNASKNAINQGATQDAITQEMGRLATSQLAGSQFSSCGMAGGVLLTSGVGAVIAGVVLSTHHSGACTTGYGNNNSTTCISNTSQHNNDLSRDLYIGGAIGMAVGVILLIGASAGC